jgi:pyroglutamyl-peptidase
MALTILVTGFGRFPGVPVNPTGPLVRKLARTVRLPCVKITAHVFETSYDAVDSELPKLIARHKPDVMLMFGLATRTRLVRVEALARNVVALLPGKLSQRHTIAPGGPATRAMPAPTRTLLAALRAAHGPATLSHDAGGYLCNYLCWRATEIVATAKGPKLAAFIHIPPVRFGARRRPTLGDLARGAGRVMTALAAAARR